MKELIDKVVNEFSKSGYPRVAFTYSDESLEIEIRIAHEYPLEMQSFMASSNFNPKEDYLLLHAMCPAIEVIEIKDPNLQNKGFFNYLVSKLLTIDIVKFVIVQNVHSPEFAYNLYESKRWEPILSPYSLTETIIKRMIPLIRSNPEEFEYINTLLIKYIDKFEPLWCKEALENFNTFLSSEESDEVLIGANKPKPPLNDSPITLILHEVSVNNYEINIPKDRNIASEKGESLETYYGKSVFEDYYTTKEMFYLP